MRVNCEECGVLFNKPPSHVRRVGRVFCSKDCYDSHQRRTNLEAGKSIRKKCKVCQVEFVVAKSEGRKYSTCSRDCFLTAKRKSNNGNWRGGVTKERNAEMSTAKYRNWRKKVFERDNRTCVICEQKPDILYADHIQSWQHYPELRYSLLNGRTLCLECHRKTFYGNYQRKLTDVQATDIVRKRRQGVKVCVLADEFGVSRGVIGKICSFKSYQHATCGLFGETFTRMGF